ncbi:MAG: hypothetical protein HY445_02300 [Candidatus Niyogibacteria bacterium]|nr:hypothetical protein [Candidatus Niyogibacteria bacterium]
MQEFHITHITFLHIPFHSGSDDNAVWHAPVDFWVRSNEKVEGKNEKLLLSTLSESHDKMNFYQKEVITGKGFGGSVVAFHMELGTGMILKLYSDTPIPEGY